MTLMEFLPIVVYLLVIVLLVVLIVLGIKLISVVGKTEKLLDDVQTKVSSFDNKFNILDFTSAKLTTGVTSIIDSVVGFIKKVFKKRKDDEYYE